MSNNSLVAKRSFAKLRSVVIKPNRCIKLLNRQSFKRNHKGGKTLRPKNKPLPKITPQQRRELVEAAQSEEDDDILNLDEKIDLFDSSDERGRLLRQSTLKPAPSCKIPNATPDPIPTNCLDNTKRIVRVVKPANSANQTVSLDIKVVPKTVSIGIQVGTPSPDLARHQPRAVVVAPGPEPPLRSYWTHKVNLPYPPAAATTEVPPQYQWTQQYYAPQFMPTVPQFPFAQAPYQQQIHGYQQPTFSRRQRRNADKRQKYLNRKGNNYE